MNSKWMNIPKLNPTIVKLFLIIVPFIQINTPSYTIFSLTKSFLSNMYNVIRSDINLQYLQQRVPQNSFQDEQASKT